MTHPIFDLSGRVAIVSGAASGMGRVTSLALAEAGADIVLLDINESGAQATAQEIEALGRRALPINCDISDADQIRSMFERVDSDMGRVDVLANIAGEGIRTDPLELTEDQIQQVMQNLVVGRYICTQEAAKRMMARGRGSIFSIVSIAGITALGRGHIAYSMAMGAVASMTRELSTEWSSLGVRVNAIVCAQIMNQDLEVRIAADPNLGSVLSARVADWPHGASQRHKRSGYLPGIRRVGVDDGRADTAGRRQPGQKRQRLASWDACRCAELSSVGETSTQEESETNGRPSRHAVE